MQKHFLPGLILTACLAAPAAAESWYWIIDDDFKIAYADADSVKRTGDIVGVDLFLGFAAGIGDANDVYYLKNSAEIACGRSEYRLLPSMTGYGPARENVPAPSDWGETDWDQITPTSLMDELKTFACDGEYRDEPVPDPFDDAEDYWNYQ